MSEIDGDGSVKVIQDPYRVENEPLDRWSFYCSLTVVVAIVVLPSWPAIMSLPGAFWTVLKVDVVPIAIYELYGLKKRRAERIETVRRRLLGRTS